MKSNAQKGFSLVELLIVVVVIGIVAAMAVPAFQRARTAAENRAAHATMRTMSSNQSMFYSQNQRFARMDELHAISGEGVGALTGNQIFRNGFTFETAPSNPTDDDLKRGFLMKGIRVVDGVIYEYELTNVGLVRIRPDDELWLSGGNN